MIAGRAAAADAAIDVALDHMLSEVSSSRAHAVRSQDHADALSPEACGLLDVAAALFAAPVPTLAARDRAAIHADLLARAAAMPGRPTGPRGKPARRFGTALAGIAFVAGLAWVGHAVTAGDARRPARGPAGDAAIGAGTVNAGPPATVVARQPTDDGKDAGLPAVVTRAGPPMAAPAPGAVSQLAAVAPTVGLPTTRPPRDSATPPATPGAITPPAIPPLERPSAPASPTASGLPTTDPAAPTATPDPTTDPETPTPLASIGIAGQVTDPEGRPLPGAVVVAEPYDGAGWFVVARAADDGDYVLDIAPGRFRVWAEASGHATRWWEGRSDAAAADPVVVGPAAITRGIDFRLPYATAPATPAFAQEVMR